MFNLVKRLLAASALIACSAQADVVTLHISAGQPLYQVSPADGTQISNDPNGLITGTVTLLTPSNSLQPLQVLDINIGLPGGSTLTISDMTAFRTIGNGGEITCHADRSFNIVFAAGQKDCYLWWINSQGVDYLADARFATAQNTTAIYAGQGSAPNHAMLIDRQITDVPITGSLPLLVAGLGGMLIASRRRFSAFIPD